ncbi:MAG: hypothetical protein D6B25_16950 [Desulfobulbaceae bacterium]|nr:MAG: hypothetical protein D6B25_16950 [Desulfobulbaceae bacterium]
MKQQSRLGTIPGISYVQKTARNRGWPYVVAWLHRITGLMLVLYVFLHILTLSGLSDPVGFEQKMQWFQKLIPLFFDWFLAIPVIFHSLNGGRLILYELFGNRLDQPVLRGVMVGSGLYLLMLAVIMIMGDQSVSPFLFWVYFFLASILCGYLVTLRLKRSGATLLWKMQRVSGTFLFLMVPAHMLFMHLDPVIGRDAQLILTRLQSPFIKLVDLLLVVSVLYHGGYGVIGVCRDYLSFRGAQLALLVLITTLFFGFGLIGVKLLFLV